jgi:poly(3-hydroxybutyrate) depolymerase
MVERRHWTVHTAILLGLALLWTTAAFPDHDKIPEPAPRATQTRLPTFAKLDRNAITVSGLSSGGFFAHQFHIAYSKLVNGAGIIAGGPYGCVENIANPYWPFWPLDRMSAAAVACTHYYGDRFYGLRPAGPKLEDSIEFVRKARRDGIIDDPGNLADDRVWLFRGGKDGIVPKGTVSALKALYEALGIRGPRLRLEERPANHGMPVIAVPRESRFPRRGCDEHRPPFIIECGYEAAEQLLAHLYAGSFEAVPKDPHQNGTLVAFDQTEFFGADARTSLSGVGYFYVPTRCREQGCRLHVAFHGCRQNADSQDAERIHDDFVRDAGYNRWAVANNLVVLYPQTTRSGANPNACWDFWGYSGSDYHGQKGRQMRVVRALVDRLLGTGTSDSQR